MERKIKREIVRQKGRERKKLRKSDGAKTVPDMESLRSQRSQNWKRRREKERERESERERKMVGVKTVLDIESQWSQEPQRWFVLGWLGSLWFYVLQRGSAGREREKKKEK